MSHSNISVSKFDGIAKDLSKLYFRKKEVYLKISLLLLFLGIVVNLFGQSATRDVFSKLKKINEPTILPINVASIKTDFFIEAHDTINFDTILQNDLNLKPIKYRRRFTATEIFVKKNEKIYTLKSADGHNLMRRHYKYNEEGQKIYEASFKKDTSETVTVWRYSYEDGKVIHGLYNQDTILSIKYLKDHIVDELKMPDRFDMKPAYFHHVQSTILQDTIRYFVKRTKSKYVNLSLRMSPDEIIDLVSNDSDSTFTFYRKRKNIDKKTLSIGFYQVNDNFEKLEEKINGWLDRHYLYKRDANGKLLEIENLIDQMSYKYEYDKNGNLLKGGPIYQFYITDVFADPGVTSYSYDLHDNWIVRSICNGYYQEARTINYK